MEQEYSIVAENISMHFNMASERLESLKEYFIKLLKRQLFFKDFVAVNDVSFKIKKGEVFGIVGTNGSGKSTLLYLIMGLLHPKGGRIMMDGKDTKERHPETLSQMFIVPEEYDLPRVNLGDYIRTIRPFYPDFDSELMVKLLDMFELTNINGATLDKDGIPSIHLGAL